MPPDEPCCGAMPAVARVRGCHLGGYGEGMSARLRRFCSGVLGVAGLVVALWGARLLATRNSVNRTGRGFSSGFVLGMGVFMVTAGAIIALLGIYAVIRGRNRHIRG